MQDLVPAPKAVSIKPLLHLRFAALVLALALAVPAVAEFRLSKRDAASLVHKVSAITENGFAPSPARLRTPVTESEVNSYLAFEARDELPSGLTEPYIAILGNNRVSGRAVVDLDAIRRQHGDNSWFDPVSYLTGRLPVAISGRLQASGGVARFELETAEISGIPIPKTFVQELVTYYSRTPSNPRGLNLDDPFPLPARIRGIEVGRGQAVVVQ